MPERKHSGRGAQINPHNHFEKHKYARAFEEGIDLPPPANVSQNSYIPAFPKSIINKVKSPDIGMEFSLNPYQGCEHGCAYCYARNSHEYWGYSSGIDFESKILIKQNADELLRRKLNKPGWKPIPIVLSGNTDCYQPIERKEKITQKLLEIFLEYGHPVGIITKNALILRDLALLKSLAELNLVRVVLSITTLQESLRRAMEPRTATIEQRFHTVKKLSDAGIPVQVNMAPIIPGLNSHEIFPLVARAADAGALKMGYTMVRLNGAIAVIFENWIRQAFSERADKVLRQIKEVHSGQLNDSRFGKRMRGEGKYADMVKETMKLAVGKYMAGRNLPAYDLTHFKRPTHGQLKLF